MFEPLITHSREAFIFGVVEDVDAGVGVFLVVVGDDVGGVIGGSVDHDEQFKVGVCLVSDGLYGVDDGVGGVVDRHDDAGTRGTHKIFPGSI